ncbi:MAG TPA: glucan biosynthesis protein, partial [Caulobacteraceae bacterium]
MDSPSVAGAYRFAITPGAATVFDVEARLYPRRTIADAGAAPLTSMFWFGGPDPLPDASADYRSAVHDSDGLEILSGAGERLWRPLASPARLQTSAFADHNPRGFGLTQRARAFDAYGDLTARYDRRPSAWIEPSGDWGAGAVMLVELPTRTEYEDNIVAFWRPAEPWMAGSEVRLAYRLSWGDGVSPPTGLARVIRSRQGAADPAPARLFTIDFPGGSIPTDRAIRLDVTASAGQVISADVQRSADPDLMRASFRYMPPARGAAELRARLMADNQPASETWAWRWS